jgi:hypothetical protein
MMNRRDFVEITLGAGAAFALTPELLQALQRQGGQLMQRAIPSTGERLPVISFAPRPTAPAGPGDIQAMPTDVPAAKQVLKAFLDNGGKVVDVLHGGPIGEQAAHTAAKALGIEQRFFWTTPLAREGHPAPSWSKARFVSPWFAGNSSTHPRLPT